MRRRDFSAVLGAAVAWALVASAQQARTIPRIGVLWHAASLEEEAVYVGALRQGLADLGYVDGKNIILLHRFPAEIPERFVSLATELVAMDVDVLVAITRLGALAAQRATAKIPIAFVYVPDPVGSKLVASLTRPGGNITGLSNFAHDLAAKRVEYLKAIVPGIVRVALLVNPNDKDNARRFIDESQAAADNLGLTLLPVEMSKTDEIVSAFSKMRHDRVDGVLMSQDGVFYSTRKEIADMALAHRLPMIVYSRETLEAGALASYGPSNYAIFYRAGAYIAKILKGAKPADLPVEQPTKFEFIINLKIAKALGLAVAPEILVRADDVIE